MALGDERAAICHIVLGVPHLIAIMMSGRAGNIRAIVALKLLLILLDSLWGGFSIHEFALGHLLSGRILIEPRLLGVTIAIGGELTDFDRLGETDGFIQVGW